MTIIPMIMMAAALAGTIGNGAGAQVQCQEAAKLLCLDNVIATLGSHADCNTEDGKAACDRLQEILDRFGITLPEENCGVIVLPGGGCDGELPDIELPELNLPGNMDTWFPEIEIPENPGIDLPETENPENGEGDLEGEKPEVPEENPEESPEAPEESPEEDTENGDTEEDSEEEDSEDEDTESAYAAQVVRLVNEERAKAGLSELKVDVLVSSAADVRAKEIVNSFSHTRPDGRSFSTALTEAGVTFRGSGENIAWGQKSPEAVMEAWMNSSGHRANILNANYTTIGVGCYEKNGVLYWTQLFTY